MMLYLLLIQALSYAAQPLKVHQPSLQVRVLTPNPRPQIAFYAHASRRFNYYLLPSVRPLGLFNTKDKFLLAS